MGLLLKREIALTSVSRDDTGPAVSGRRPVIVTFENFKDRDSVLRRAPVLKKSGLHVTEDLSKSVREVRANLTKFMRAWKKQNPDSYCHLQFDKLYIDNRLYVWDKESGEVRISCSCFWAQCRTSWCWKKFALSCRWLSKRATWKGG